MRARTWDGEPCEFVLICTVHNIKQSLKSWNQATSGGSLQSSVETEDNRLRHYLIGFYYSGKYLLLADPILEVDVRGFDSVLNVS